MPAGQTPSTRPRDDDHQHHVDREHGAERQQLAEQDLERRGGRQLELVEGARQALVHDRDRGDQHGEEREHEAEGARDHERPARELRVEERLRDDFDAAGALAAPRARRAGRAPRCARRSPSRSRAGTRRRCRRARSRRRRRAPAPRARGAPRARANALWRSGGRISAVLMRPATSAASSASRVGYATRIEGAARREIRDEAPAHRAAARVVDAEAHVLDVGREHRREGEQRDERHGDQRDHRERIAQRRAHLADDERAQAPERSSRAPACAR